ncbi:MAG TPA: hypothetical protein V6D11_31325 [Waterburya sp.]
MRHPKAVSTSFGAANPQAKTASLECRSNGNTLATSAFYGSKDGVAMLLGCHMPKIQRFILYVPEFNYRWGH